MLRHGVSRPLWLCDVALAVEMRPPDFDWARCLGPSRRVAHWVICAIGLANRLLGARVNDTPFSARAGHLPRWLAPAVLRQWGKEHRALAPLASHLRHPGRLLAEMPAHWPNGIQATVALRRSFNAWPRLPYRLLLLFEGWGASSRTVPAGDIRVSDKPRVGRDPLVDVLLVALTDPDTVAPSSVEVLPSLLRLAAHDESRAALALAVVAALLYSRPDLVPDALIESVAELLWTGSPPDHIARRGGKLWEFLATSDAAPRAWALLSQILQDPRLGPETRARLVPLVGTFAQWREDLVDLDALLTLAACPELATHRAALLDHGVERAVFSGPEHFTLPRLRRLGELFGHLTRYRYVLYALAGRPGLPPAARTHVEAELGGRFTFQERAATILTRRPIRVLVVMNVGMGQGDEMVRLVPLLQALLDANPALTITLVTRRRYLYDHPRVTVVPIGDDVLVQAALREPFDGLLEFFQPEWAHFVHRLELHPAIEELRAARPPAFLIQGDYGPCLAGASGQAVAVPVSAGGARR